MIFLSHILTTHIKKNSQINVRYWLVTIFLAGLCSVAPLQAQSLTGSHAGKSVDVYGGAAITTLGQGMLAGITFRNGGHQFIFRGVSTDLEPAGETWEIAGLYGRVFAVESFEFSAGAGVGVIGGSGYSHLFAVGSEQRLETMIGFPLEGRITWRPARQAGIGLCSFTNINTVQPIGGLALTVHLGF